MHANKWTLAEGWTIANTEAGVPLVVECLECKDDTMYIYKGEEIWRFRNGRCVETTFKRFEDLMRKALKLAQEDENLFWTDDGVYTSDGSLLACNEHLTRMQELGFVHGEKILIPEKFNAAQKEYALLNADEIQWRIFWLDEES